MIVFREYILLVVLQFIESMYLGVKYLGFGRYNDGKFGFYFL